MAQWRVNKKEDQPDFFLPPELSFVLQIKCAELVPSTAFSAGVTCRFPRVQRYSVCVCCENKLSMHFRDRGLYKEML